MWRILLISLLVVIFTGCGGQSSDNSSGKTVTKDKNTTDQVDNQEKTDERGVIRFRVNNSSFRTLATNSATGKLIATADKIKLGIENAQAINKDDIKEVEQGVFEISNIPVSTNAAITLVDDLGKGLELDNLKVESDKTTDLGTLDLNQTYNIKMSIESNVFSEVWVNINSLAFAKKIAVYNPVDVSKVPQGNYFISISDINGNIIVSKYANIQNDNVSLDFDLDENAFNGKLSGQVRDANGQALENVTVYLKSSRENYLASLTEADGSFEFVHLPKGEYTLKIQKNGYRPKVLQNITLGDNIVEQNNIQLELEDKLGAISGYVYFSDTQEHAGIDITVEKTDGVFETKQNGSLKDGAFLITDLPVGEYILNFGKSGDSTYQQISTQKLSVIAGVTTTLEKGYVLNKLVANVNGVVSLPASTDDVSKIFVKIQDANGQDVKTSGLVYDKDENGRKLYDYNMSVPIGDNYKLIISGSDQDGTELETYINTKDFASLETGDQITVPMVTLNYLIATIEGVVSIPASIDDVSKIFVRIQDANGQDVKTSGLVYDRDENGTKLYSYSMTVPIGDNYKLIITGSDKDGNELVPYTEDLGDLEAGGTKEIENQQIEYVDKNPPVFKGYNVSNLSEKMQKNKDGDYYVNPGNELLVETIAQDADGDTISYIFNTTDGKFTEIDESKGRAHFLAPSEGGSITLSVTAKSGSREAVENILIYVNNAPTITVTDSTFIDPKNPKIFNSSDMITISSKVLDVEDQDLNISWSSNVQDDLNVTSEVFQKVLLPGTHTITQIVRDSNGLYAQQNYYVKVVPKNMVWLKAPLAGTVKLYQTNETLADNYQIDITGVESSLNYESLDTSVATVDSNGLVQSVATGSTKIKITSTDTDQQGNPVYEIYLAVRILDKLENQDKSTFKLRPGATVQLEVANSSALMEDDGYIHISLDTKYEGAYEVVFYDQKDIIDDSRTSGVLYIDGVASGSTKTGVGNLIFSFEVINTSKDYEIRVKPYGINDDEYVKVALVPANDVKDINGNSISSIVRDNENEFNDIAETAALISINNEVSSNINYLDFDTVDWFAIDLPKGKSTIDFSIINGNGGSTYVEVLDPAGQKVWNTAVSNSADRYIKKVVDAQSSGIYKVRIYNGYNYNTFYKFKFSPSVANGLIQNDISLEQNDWDFNAYPIEMNQTISSSVNNIEHDTNDWFAIDLPKGKSTIDFSIINGNGGSTYVEVLDPDGQKVWNTTAVSNSADRYIKKVVDAQSSGIYKVHIYNGYNYNSFYEFKFSPSVANGLVQDSSTYEQNDWDFNAYPIKMNQTISSSVNNIEHDTNDWFAIDLPKGKSTIDFSIINGNGGSTYVEVLDPAGQEVWNTTAVSNSADRYIKKVVDAQSSGIYKVRIYNGYNYNSFYEFKFSPSVANGLIQNDISLEQNDWDFNAYPIKMNQTISSSVNNIEHDTNDWFAIDLPQGESTIDFSIINGNGGNAYIQVLDPAGQKVLDKSVYAYAGRYMKEVIDAQSSGKYKVRIYNSYNYNTFYEFIIQ